MFIYDGMMVCWNQRGTSPNPISDHLQVSMGYLTAAHVSCSETPDTQQGLIPSILGSIINSHEYTIYCLRAYG